MVTRPICVANHIHDPVGQALFEESTTFPRATITEEELSFPLNARGSCDISSQGPHWANSSSMFPLSPGGGLNRASRMGWLRCECDSTLGKNAVFGHRVIPEPSEIHLRHESLTGRACSLLTRFADGVLGALGGCNL